MVLKGNSESSKESTNKKQQFPLTSQDFYLGKYLEKAVDKFIDSNYGNKLSVNDEEIDYLAFFDTTEKMKQLLVGECKFENYNKRQNKIPKT